MRWPSLPVIDAVLSFGTPMMLRLKCVPLGAPLPVVETDAVVTLEVEVEVFFVDDCFADVVDVPAVVEIADETADVAEVIAEVVALSAAVVASGAAAYAPATNAGEKAIAQ